MNQAITTNRLYNLLMEELTQLEYPGSQQHQLVTSVVAELCKVFTECEISFIEGSATYSAECNICNEKFQALAPIKLVEHVSYPGRYVAHIITTVVKGRDTYAARVRDTQEPLGASMVYGKTPVNKGVAK